MNERIKLIRKEASLTQEAFAARLSLTRNFIAQVEMGVKEPSDRTIRDICREFGVNEIWLREGEGDPYVNTERSHEMAALVASLTQDKSESFRKQLITTLLRFDPNGPEWEALERIYDSIASQRDPGE